MNQLTFNHAMTHYDNETSIYEINKVREYRDITTDCFTRSFLTGSAQLTHAKNTFVDFTYNYINTQLQVRIDSELINLNQKPMFDDEKVYLIFKGGNIMNIYFEKFLNFTPAINGTPLANSLGVNNYLPCSNPFNPVCNQENIGNFVTYLSNNFKVSDVDYSLYILTNDNSRYILLHSICKNILVDSFKYITDFFNKLYSESNINNVALRSNYSYTNIEINTQYEENNILSFLQSTLTQDTWINIFDIFKTYIHNDLVTLDHTGTLQRAHPIVINVIVQSIQLLIQTKNNIIYAVNNWRKSLDRLILQYKILTLFKYINNKFGIKFNLMIEPVGYPDKINLILEKILLDINNILDRKKNNVIQSEFYTQVKINALKNNLVIGYNVPAGNSLYNDKYEVFNNVNKLTINKYKYKQKNGATPQLNNFVIIPNNNVLVYANNSGDIQQKIISLAIPNNFHYITYNNIINKTRNYKYSSIFDLIRIKFNVVLNGGFIEKNDKELNMQIPSEFIDISIPRYNDYSKYLFSKHLYGSKPTNLRINYNPIAGALRTTVTIPSYSINDLYEDLIYVLFSQNISSQPWMDSKYKKRVIRLLFLGILDAKINDIENNNNDNITIFSEVIRLSDSLLDYINGGGAYPYNEITKFVVETNGVPITPADNTYCQRIIDDIVNKKMDIDIENIIYIIPKYHSVKNILLCLILFSKLYNETDISIINTLNYSRNLYYWESYTDSTQYNNIVNNIKRNYRELLLLIVNVGNHIVQLINLINRGVPGVRRLPVVPGLANIDFIGGNKEKIIRYKLNL